ncbi:hypothetical protein K439DRAFT_1651505 [Ramaria rubella]|nr:hypothetical protein K439DRAFT_1651505 [Ramaria rubella]
MSFNNLPLFKDLPAFNKDLPGQAWEVWGKGDQLGTVNLLTDDVVQRAASEGIKRVHAFCLSFVFLPVRPVNFPAKPLYGRKAPDHRIVSNTAVPRPAVNDDELHINTQSGTQWDGLRHFGIASAAVFYQGVPADSIQKGKIEIDDPLNVDPDLIKLGIHNWAQHGICGRGVLLDMVKFYTESGTKPLPYDPWTSHAIPASDLKAAAKQEGVEFRQGDILLLRVGFIQRYRQSNAEEKSGLRGKPETFAGIQQGLETKEFLWNNHFAAIASDQPALERWPPVQGELHLHQTLLGLWGMPIGEFFDLENLAKVADETGRYTFFFSSWPLNVLGGVASPPNAAAIF